jgi:hypothetical protein
LNYWQLCMTSFNKNFLSPPIWLLRLPYGA